MSKKFCLFLYIVHTMKLVKASWICSTYAVLLYNIYVKKIIMSKTCNRIMNLCMKIMKSFTQGKVSHPFGIGKVTPLRPPPSIHPAAPTTRYTYCMSIKSCHCTSSSGHETADVYDETTDRDQDHQHDH